MVAGPLPRSAVLCAISCSLPCFRPIACHRGAKNTKEGKEREEGRTAVTLRCRHPVPEVPAG